MANKNDKLRYFVAPDSLQEQAGIKGTVLVVDDFRLTRVALKGVLQSAGYTVIEAESSSRALDIIGSYPVNLVIADIKMADADGLEIVQRIRFNAKTANIPMILCTASSEALNVWRLRVQGFLMKPIRPQAVLKLVDEVVNSTNGSHHRSMASRPALFSTETSKESVVQNGRAF